MTSNNRFNTFADPEDIAAAAAVKASETKKAAPKENKKLVVKPKVEQNNNRDATGEEEFERIEGRRTQTASRRGGERGGRGGDRGGRGRGGDRGGRGRGGDRGGRGRGDQVQGRGRGGDRPQTGAREGQRRFQGKPREEAHPMDKKSGTGRGKRDERKDGHGKGNWGTDKAVAEDGKKIVDEEEKKDDVTEEKKEEAKPIDIEEKVEEVLEVQEVGITLDDFLAQKQASSKGLLSAQAAGRSHGKQTTKGIEVSEAEKRRITTIDSKLTGKDVYAVTRGDGADFLGFSSKDEDDFTTGRPAAGGRGDRERRERGPRQPRGGKGRGGRNGGKIQIDDESFPAL